MKTRKVERKSVVRSWRIPYTVWVELKRVAKKQKIKPSELILFAVAKEIGFEFVPDKWKKVRA